MFLLRWCQKTKMDKQKSPLPAGREAFQNAVPLSCFARGACIAAQTEGIAPPTPGRIFPRRSTGRLAAQWPPLSAVDGMGYFSRSPWLAVYYISSDGGMCQGEVCGGWLLCALTGRFPLANEARSCYNLLEKQECGSLRVRQHPQTYAGDASTYTTATMAAPHGHYTANPPLLQGAVPQCVPCCIRNSFLTPCGRIPARRFCFSPGALGAVLPIGLLR